MSTDKGTTNIRGPRISAAALDSLMSTLEVSFVALSECLVSKGHILELGGASVPGIHYNLAGEGKMYLRNDPPIDLKPHTLVIVPANSSFRIEVPGPNGVAGIRTVDGSRQSTINGTVRKFVAGDGDPQIILICGFFNASFGSTTDLFGPLSAPIVEQFDANDRLDERLRWAMEELITQEVGNGAMTSALLKQVIVTVLRRSLQSVNLWVERFAMLSDPQVSRAFAEMVANPGGPHTVQSLAHVANLSRSAFMARFVERVGRTPMLVLRDLRMRLAAQQLETSDLPVYRIAHNAGYSSRSSFVRVFREAFDRDPTDYRLLARASRENGPLPESNPALGTFKDETSSARDGTACHE